MNRPASHQLGHDRCATWQRMATTAAADEADIRKINIRTSSALQCHRANTT